MAAVTPAFLEPYLTTKYRHVYYHDAVELAEELAVHANGEFPDDLITERRPAESEEIKNYREKIFTPITKPVFTKVYNSLMKIRKSSDWMISFPSDVPAMIAADETPEEYLMKKFPRNGTLREDRAFVKALPTDNPNLEPAYLEKLSRLPEIDRKRLLDGDWDYDESNDRLYYYDDLLRCFRNEINGTTMFITADIAALGNDKTIIGLWSGLSLVDVFVMEQKYPNEVAEFIRNLAKERNVKLGNIVVDADGLGIGVVGILKCQSFNNGGRAVSRQEFWKE